MRKKEDQFEKLARLIKEEGEEIRSELKAELGGKIDKLERKVSEGFAAVDVRFTGVERRLDNIVQPQLDSHAFRIKTLETKDR